VDLRRCLDMLRRAWPTQHWDLGGSPTAQRVRLVESPRICRRTNRCFLECGANLRCELRRPERRARLCNKDSTKAGDGSGQRQTGAMDITHEKIFSWGPNAACSSQLRHFHKLAMTLAGGWHLGLAFRDPFLCCRRFQEVAILFSASAQLLSSNVLTMAVVERRNRGGTAAERGTLRERERDRARPR